MTKRAKAGRTAKPAKKSARPASGRNAIAASIDALPEGRYLLAVSGGRDSMVLMNAFAAARPAQVAVVASFDHGTGPAATRAADHTRREGERRGLTVVTGSRTGRVMSDGADAAKVQAGEEEWRRARWEFLNAQARELGATIVTGHTLDDQVETIFMRIFRHAGARGIAAMFAPSPIVRPFIRVPRDDVADYAKSKGIKFLEDPTNASMRFLRNRIRHELLPAAERVQPGISAELIRIAERAAEWREIVADCVDILGAVDVAIKPGQGDEGTLSVAIPAPALIGMQRELLGVIWPELVARAGGSLDWRGLARLNGEAGMLKAGSEIPIAGGLSVMRTPTSFVVRNQGVDGPLY